MNFTTHLFVRSARYGVALAVFVVATSASLTASAFLQIYDFDNANENWRFDFGGPNSTVSVDPTQNSPGNNQGALKLVMPFPYNGSFAFTGDRFFPGQNLTADSTILFDVLVDPSSAHDAFGLYGFFKFVSRETDNYNYNVLFQGNLPNLSGWQTFSAPTSTMTQTRAFTFELFGGGSQNIQGPVTLWLDNIRTVPEPTSLAIIAMGAIGCFGFVRRKHHRN